MAGFALLYFAVRAVLHWLLQKATEKTVQVFANCSFLDTHIQAYFHGFLTGKLLIGWQGILETFLVLVELVFF